MNGVLFKKKSIIILCVLGFAVLIGALFIFLPAVKKPQAVKAPQANALLSLYQGTILSLENNYLRVRLTNGGMIAGFFTDKKTVVVQNQEGKEIPKSISDIPKDATVSIQTLSNSEARSYKAEKIIYEK